jgi:hypothetical protein
VATLNLNFLNRRAVNKQVCRVCQAFADLKSERLCAECASIKAQLRSRFPDTSHQMTADHQCKRPSCVCTACNVRTLDLHPFYPSGPASREMHFHPRCHALWLEVGLGADATSTLILE